MGESQQTAADSGIFEYIFGPENSLFQRCRTQALTASLVWAFGGSIDYWGQSIPADSTLALPTHADLLAVRLNECAGQTDPLLEGALASVGRSDLLEDDFLPSPGCCAAMPATMTQSDSKTLADMDKRMRQILIKFAELYVKVHGKLYNTTAATFAHELAQLKKRVEISWTARSYCSLPQEFKSAIEESKDVAVVFDIIDVEVKAVIKRLDDAKQRLTEEGEQARDAYITSQRNRLIELHLCMSRSILGLSTYIVGN